MNLNLIKTNIKSHLGIKHHFIYKGIRNQSEEFDGVITKLFSAIFLIQVTDGTIRSFSYNDYIIGNIIIVS